MAQKLTDTKIFKAQKREKTYMLADGGGLCLYVTTTGSKLWRWRYRFEGVPKMMAFGAYPDLSLQEARKLHEAMRNVLKKGTDPMQTRKAEREHFTQTTKPPVVMTTVKVVRDEKGNKLVKVTPVVNGFHWVYLQWYDKWSADKDARHASQVKDRVEKDILPKLGHRPIADIEAPEIAAVALSIQERGALDLAHRSLNTMSQIFRFGITMGYCRRNPAADIKAGDFLKGTNPQNFARVDQKEFPKLLRAIERYNGMPITRIMLKLMLRVWVRTSELILSPWSEFTFRNGKLSDTVWTIPAARMKKVKGTPVPHLVPLSRQVVALLEELHVLTGDTKWLFPGQKDLTKCMSKNTILAALNTMGYKGQMTGHGFRGLASTCLNERQYNAKHIEVQLAHLERSTVSGAYNYAEYLEPRKKMMQDWSDYLDEQLMLAKR
jgi:integrase